MATRYLLMAVLAATVAHQVHYTVTAPASIDPEEEQQLVLPLRPQLPLATGLLLLTSCAGLAGIAAAHGYLLRAMGLTLAPAAAAILTQASLSLTVGPFVRACYVAMAMTYCMRAYAAARQISNAASDSRDAVALAMHSASEIEAFTQTPADRRAAVERLRKNDLLAVLNVVLFYDLTSLRPRSQLSEAARKLYDRGTRFQCRLALMKLALGTAITHRLVRGYAPLAAFAGLGTWDPYVKEVHLHCTGTESWGGQLVTGMLAAGYSKAAVGLVGILSLHLGTVLNFIAAMLLADVVVREGWSMVGYNVRPMMISPWQSRHLAEFWSVRYNTVVGHMLRKCCWEPVRALGLPSAVAVLVTFTVSGLLHALPPLAVDAPLPYAGLVFLYFAWHAIAVLVDSAVLLPRKWDDARWLLAAVSLFLPWTFLAHALMVSAARLYEC